MYRRQKDGWFAIMHRAVMTDSEIVQAVAKMDPFPDGDIGTWAATCVFCSGDTRHGHDEDCIWKAAKGCYPRVEDES